MDPISNQIFSHDYPKFVYQNPDAYLVNNQLDQPKPFRLKSPEKSDKTKKDMKKAKEQSQNNKDGSKKTPKNRQLF